MHPRPRSGARNVTWCDGNIFVGILVPRCFCRLVVIVIVVVSVSLLLSSLSSSPLPCCCRVVIVAVFIAVGVVTGVVEVVGVLAPRSC